MEEFPILRDAFVSRTSGGQTHGNTLTLRLKVVVVYLDIPHVAADSDNLGYRLICQTEGKYDRTLKRTDSVILNHKRAALYFTEIYPFGKYSLYQCVTPEIKLPIFLDVPYDDLPDFGEDAPKLEARPEEKPLVLKTPPQLKTVDSMVHPHVYDCQLDKSSYLNVIALQSHWRRNIQGQPDDDSDIA